MIYLYIKENRRPKKYTLVDGLAWLESREAMNYQTNAIEKIPIEIVDSTNKEFGFKGDIPVGEGVIEEFFSWIEDVLLERFPNQEEEIADFIAILVTEYTNQSKQELQEETKKSQIPDTRKKKRWKLIMLSFLVVSFFLISGFSIFKLAPKFMKTESQEQTVKDTYQEDLAALSPKQLGEKYPDKLDEIAAYYVKQKDFESLKTFNALYPTDNGTFDLAFHEEDWETVITSDVAELTDERKIMLAHSYIMLNQLEEAEILNQSIKSSVLEEEIDSKRIEEGLELIHHQKIKEAKKIMDQLHSEKAKRMLQVYLDDAELIMQMINLYKGKKDTDNQAIWIRKLEEIGKVEENEL